MLDYFNTAVDFIMQFKPTTVYNIAGMKIGEESVLSEGGYSYVYLAHDRDNYSQKYALKKIIVQDKINEEAVMREIEQWSLLGDHPNIWKYIGHTEIEGDDAKTVVIWWEFWSGGTLVDLLTRNKNKLIEEQIIYVLTHIARGLKLMHNHDPPISHRDIKVENILMEDQVFKLADFGSWSTDTLNYSKDSKKVIVEKMELFEKYTTMMYRPPEMIDQYLNYSVNTKVDIWMLGCVLFTLWYAKHPFQEAQKLAIVNAHYTFPDEKDKRIGSKLKDLIRLMLTPNPSKRPDINKILDLLESWDELDNIPLSDEAIKIKSKQEAIVQAKNKNYKEVSHIDLLGFEEDTPKHKSVIQCKLDSVNLFNMK